MKFLPKSFVSFFTKIGSQINQEAKDQSGQLDTEEFDDNRGLHHSFYFTECTMDDITQAVKSIKSNAAGVDGLNIKAFKAVAAYLLPVILYLVNLSVQKGVFPDELKRAKVIPLHKGGDKRDISNWRPISILPLFSKIYEKVVYKKIYEYMNSLGFLSDSQFGFRKGHSTVHAVHHLLDCVNSALENNLIPLTIFIDLKKAFDTVDFEVLLKRLRNLGIKDTALSWFRSYLCGRSMKVVMSDISSAAMPINCGVPQGSVLGPLLFLVYVDTLRFYLNDSVLTSFADDTAITVFARTSKEVVQKANHVLSRLHVFTALSSLAVNQEKRILWCLVELVYLNFLKMCFITVLA